MLKVTSASTSGAEQGIDQYIPRDVRRMFYRNPARVHASHNGFDPYGFSIRGLVLYLPLWALNPGATYNFKSIDTYKHTATVTGALWQPNARYFDGSDDNIDCGNAASLDLRSAVTLIAWSNMTVAQQGVLISKGGYNVGYQLTHHTTNFSSMLIKDGSANLSYRSGTVTTATATWHHIAGTYDGTDQNGIHFYHNGSLDDRSLTDTCSGDIEDQSANPLLINGLAGRRLNGLIGEVFVYNRALSAVEIADNYNRTVWRY